MTYVTKQGDMWDFVAWRVYGSESYVTVLYRANPQYMDVYVFDAGVILECPELTVEETTEESIPEWRDFVCPDEEVDIMDMYQEDEYE